MGAVFVFAAPFFALGSLVTPSVQAATSQGRGERTGPLQGSLGAMTSLSGLVAPLIYTQIFAYAIGPGRPPARRKSHVSGGGLPRAGSGHRSIPEE